MYLTPHVGKTLHMDSLAHLVCWLCAHVVAHLDVLTLTARRRHYFEWSMMQTCALATAMTVMVMVVQWRSVRGRDQDDAGPRMMARGGGHVLRYHG